MEDRFIEENVRERLILSGIKELEERGISDFSLRRAALGAQVSCAAPYRHFKSKEDYLLEIASYVASKWELLSNQIAEVFSQDTRALVIETAIANLRFRIANRNFPLFHLYTRESGKGLEDAIRRAVKRYSSERGLLPEDEKLKIFTAESLIVGAVSMVNDKNADEILRLTRQKLMLEF